MRRRTSDVAAQLIKEGLVRELALLGIAARPRLSTEFGNRLDKRWQFLLAFQLVCECRVHGLRQTYASQSCHPTGQAVRLRVFDMKCHSVSEQVYVDSHGVLTKLPPAAMAGSSDSHCRACRCRAPRLLHPRLS